jgi:hypothetical protein
VALLQITVSSMGPVLEPEMLPVKSAWGDDQLDALVGSVEVR